MSENSPSSDSGGEGERPSPTTGIPPMGDVIKSAAPGTSDRDNDASRAPPFTHTRASGYWAAVVVGLLVLLVLIIFILENGQRASVSFFGAHGHLPQGVALLLAAVIGGLFVVFAGAARILQLRSRSRGQSKRHRPAASENTEPELRRLWRRSGPR